MVVVSAGVEDNITPRLHYTLLSNNIGVALYFILYHYTLYIIPRLHYTLLSNDVGAATPLMRVNVIWRVAGSPDGRIQV